MSIRRAIIWASTGQYLVIATNLLVTLILARLLTPFDFGVSALGIAVIGMAEAVRELAGGTFLIRERELTRDKIRTTFTLNVLITIAVASVLALAAEPLARVFDLPALAPYLEIAIIGYLMGPFIYSQQAIMVREGSFRRLAFVNLVPAVGGAAVAIALAVAGWGPMSFAWAAVATTIMATVMSILFGKGVSIYKPTVSHWQAVLGFGLHSSATAIIGRLAEAMPLLLLGRVLGPAELAIGHRALLLSLIPEKLILAVSSLVALPEMSRAARASGELSKAYLAALQNISAVHWPVMLMLALLAEPIVQIALGPQWLDAVPLLWILGPALMFTTPLFLQFPTLVAAERVKFLPLILVVQTAVIAAALALTAGYGLKAAVASMLVALPINALVSLVVVTRVLGIGSWDVLRALARSGVVAVFTAAAPLALALDFPGSMPLAGAAIIAAVGAIGWMAGLLLADHPLRGFLDRKPAVQADAASRN